MRILDQIRKYALDQPTKIALRNEMNEQITYKKLYEYALGVSEGLKKRRDVGNSVAILCKDPIQMAIGLRQTLK